MNDSANARRLKRVSKFCALALRHHPDAFGLDPDADGFVSLADLLDVFAAIPRFADVTEATLREIIAQSDKPRYEIRDAIEAENQPALIRARYGHSFLTVTYTPVTPPARLVHGTNAATISTIRDTGLSAMSRKYVHLTTDDEMAITVGNRHGGKTVLLVIRALEAHRAGVPFFNPAGEIFLATHIPADFIDFPTRA